MKNIIQLCLFSFTILFFLQNAAIAQTCTNGVVSNSGFEDPGAALFQETFEGNPAEPLPKNSEIIPNWYMDYSCPADPGPCPDGYWIDDSADNVNNPEGDYFIWFPADAYCARVLLTGLVAGDCFEISFSAASWSVPNPQEEAEFVLEIDPPGSDNTFGASFLTLAPSTLWSNLNWQTDTYTYTVPESGDYRFLFSQTNNDFNPTIAKKGIAIDDLCISPITCPATCPVTQCLDVNVTKN
ncbi:MAG: hypothetical protein ACPG5B_11210 [Chitinophagales bacterium]